MIPFRIVDNFPVCIFLIVSNTEDNYHRPQLIETSAMVVILVYRFQTDHALQTPAARSKITYDYYAEHQKNM